VSKGLIILSDALYRSPFPSHKILGLLNNLEPDRDILGRLALIRTRVGWLSLPTLVNILRYKALRGHNSRVTNEICLPGVRCSWNVFDTGAVSLTGKGVWGESAGHGRFHDIVPSNTRSLFHSGNRGWRDGESLGWVSSKLNFTLWTGCGGLVDRRFSCFVKTLMVYIYIYIYNQRNHILWPIQSVVNSCRHGN